MGGFMVRTPNRNIAQMYRGACTPLPDRGEEQEAEFDDTHNAIVAVLLPFVSVSVTIASLIFLGTKTVDANAFVNPVLRTVIMGFAAVAMAVAMALWKRVWYIDDMPTIEVAGAHPGACEFVGRVRTGSPTTAWFSGLPVVWWSAQIHEKQSDSDGSSKWVKIWDEQGGSRVFWLDDGTGMVKVNCKGAGGGGWRRTVDRKIGSYRIVEQALVVDQKVFVTGPVQFERDGMLCVRRPRNKIETGHGAPYWISFSEARLRSSFKGFAVLATALSLLLAAASSLWTTAPSTLETHLGEPTLVLRETSLMVPALIIFGGVLMVHLLHYAVRLFNRLIALKHQASFAFATIDVAAARRHDLITQMVDVVKAASNHERQALEQAIRNRTQLPSDANVDKVSKTIVGDNQKRTMIGLQEAHPGIVTAENYADLFENLIDTENRIAASRRFYNDAVTMLRDRAGSFPGILLAPFVVGGSIPELLSIDLGAGEATADGAAVMASGTNLGPVETDGLVNFDEASLFEDFDAA